MKLPSNSTAPKIVATEALVQFAGLPTFQPSGEVKGGEMAGLLSLDELFEGRHFDREIIVLCVRWYLRLKLSFRDLVEMMAERGLSMAHTTIMPGCITTLRSLSAAGTGSHDRPGPRGVSTRPT
jgi:hypothetical protein